MKRLICAVLSAAFMTCSVSAASGAYSEYIDENKTAELPKQIINIDISRFAPSDQSVAQYEQDYSGKPATITGDTGTIEFQFEVETAGFYSLYIEYMAVAGRRANIERAIKIDREYPFDEARSISFSRVYKNQTEEFAADGNGNQTRPEQIEEFVWRKTAVYAFGYYNDDALTFYLSAGSHTVSLESISQSMAIATLCFSNPDVKSYDETIKKNTPSAFDAEPIRLEAEHSTYKSDPMLYPKNDMSSPANSPFDNTKLRLNVVGGESWKQSGQWMLWSFDVTESGYYQLALRAKQNFKAGTYSCRRLLVDGELPFSEAAAINAAYSTDWQMINLPDSPYIYFEAGTHTIELQAVLGEQAEPFQKAEKSLSGLNEIYRRIMMVTGANPDTMRDYNIARIFPELTGELETMKKELESVSKQLSGMQGAGSETAVIDKLCYQLGDFIADIETLPKRLTTFNSNISALAAWLITATQQQLLIDYAVLMPYGRTLPEADKAWYEKLWSEIVRLFMSFFNDYNIISDNSAQTGKTPVTVWLGVGRDQANIVRSIVTTGFTEKSGIPFILKLVSPDLILRAVASGTGPDAALFQDKSTPVNYAMRSAAYDLKNFDDCDEVLRRFSDAAIEPFRLNGSVYALPEQQTFDVLFYRTDILSELGLKVPDTWEDLYRQLVILQKNHMEFGIVSSFTTATNTTLNPLYTSFVYQNGGQIYNEAGDKCALYSPEGIKAFTNFCELYTKYSFPLKVDVLTRFRTGESPMAINSFTFMNELMVSAPEIKGLWDIAPLPGTRDKDGGINRSAAVNSSGAIIFPNAASLDNTWEFLKWWTSAEAQISYSDEMEALQGVTGRWPSANLEAMKELDWTGKYTAAISEQSKWLVGIPEVAGGYYTGRSINNAIRSSVNYESLPKDNLYNAVLEINTEIELKRKELKLD